MCPETLNVYWGGGGRSGLCLSLRLRVFFFWFFFLKQQIEDFVLGGGAPSVGDGFHYFWLRYYTYDPDTER